MSAARSQLDFPGVRRRRAFTLIELLVVVAIIAALVAILIPSLANARRSARMVVCSSNLKQWGVAVRIYSDSYDGWLPRRGQGVNPTQQIDRPTDWFNALAIVSITERECRRPALPRGSCNPLKCFKIATAIPGSFHKTPSFESNHRNCPKACVSQN